MDERLVQPCCKLWEPLPDLSGDLCPENGVLKAFCEVDANECVCCALDVLLFENTVLL